MAINQTGKYVCGRCYTHVGSLGELCYDCGQKLDSYGRAQLIVKDVIEDPYSSSVERQLAYALSEILEVIK